MRRWVGVLAGLCVAAGAAAACSTSRASQRVPPSAPGSAPPARVAPQPPAPAPAARSGWRRWLNPTTAPFLPIPYVDVDPNSGTTVGLLPTWLSTDRQGNIRRIIAPDVVRTTYFGYGVHGRVFAYPSANRQWSVEGGVDQQVQAEFDAEYYDGLLRDTRWSESLSAIYNRKGTPRFYGIGNESPVSDVSGYTEQQALIQARAGLNLSHAWQIGLLLRLSDVKVLPGTIPTLVSIRRRFGLLTGIGRNNQLVQRISLTYDTRNDLTIPTRGGEFVVYVGLASRQGILNDSMYAETGADARYFWSPMARTTIAAHFAARYLPTVHHVPFWALSNLGGDQAVIGGAQPLRGYGAGRFYGRNLISASLELRQTVLSFDSESTPIYLQITPFIDIGRVFQNPDSLPLTHMHHVFGVGFRGLAPPTVVGYVDFGYASQGLAVFTGIDFPF